uniref:Uncharacterized protein n=1 Tax=Micrurus surinamensis TaxID=129470 RepID=A0A2D4PN13_MICSU
MRQPVVTISDSEEMECQDREQLSAEGAIPTDTQDIQQRIEANECPLSTHHNEGIVQVEDIEPQPSTSRGIQEPSCKKQKKWGVEHAHIDSCDDSVSDERNMSQTQTAEEGEPSEDFDVLNTTEETSVHLECIRSWQRELQHYRAIEYYERYRFVNIEHVRSFTYAIDVIHNEVQRLLNRISREISPNDFVQLRMDAEELGRPLFSVRKPLEELNADQFLSYVESLLQSNVEILWRNSLDFNSHNCEELRGWWS